MNLMSCWFGYLSFCSKPSIGVHWKETWEGHGFFGKNSKRMTFSMLYTKMYNKLWHQSGFNLTVIKFAVAIQKCLLLRHVCQYYRILLHGHLMYRYSEFYESLYLKIYLLMGILNGILIRLYKDSLYCL